MRGLIIISIGFFFVSSAIAQDSTDYDSFASSFGVVYGQKYFQNSVLGEGVNNLKNAKFGLPLTYIGISATGVFAVGEKSDSSPFFDFYGAMIFYHLIPQKITVDDTVSGRLSGFNVSIPLIGWDFFHRKRAVDLIVGAGFNTGRIRLFGDAKLEQVNAYFAPSISLTPRFSVGNISFHFRVEYELDITRSRWRKVWFSSSPKVDLGPMRSTGLSASFSIGRTL